MRTQSTLALKLLAGLLAALVAFAGLTTDAPAQDNSAPEPAVVQTCGENDTADEQLGCTAVRSFLLGGLLLAKVAVGAAIATKVAVGAAVAGAVVGAVAKNKGNNKTTVVEIPAPVAPVAPAPTPTPAGSGPVVPFPAPTSAAVDSVGSAGIAPVPTAVVVVPPTPAAIVTDVTDAVVDVYDAVGEVLADRADLENQVDSRLRRFLTFFEAIRGWLEPNVQVEAETPAAVDTDTVDAETVDTTDTDTVDTDDTIVEIPELTAERASR